MREKQHDVLVYLCEEYLTGAAENALHGILDDARLDSALPITGMVGDILPVEAAAQPLLRFERTADDKVLQDYADMKSEGYGFPLEAGQAGLEGSQFWKVAFAYVAYLKDQPVSAAAAIVNDGLIYLALVATRPPAQRNGFSEATVRHALSEAHKVTGLQRTLLHATDTGEPSTEIETSGIPVA
jgi:hypothetical protein